MGLKCGIVGLPNVGKSTLFNALTQTAAAEAANYPFCTIEPNVGTVAVHDSRLDKLASIVGSEKTIYAQIEFVDIAGLVKGASKGEGLGNQFLSHIREVDAVIHLLRCFDDENIVHVEGSIDPIRDAEVIDLELVLADLASVEKRIPNIEKKAKTNKEFQKELELLKECFKCLSDGKPVRSIVTNANKDEMSKLQLITSKPILYVCNVPENEVATGNTLSEKVAEFASKHGATAIFISAQIESEIANLGSEEDKAEFIEALGMKETGLNRLVKSAHSLLGLITYFTVGPKEARAWTIKKGIAAPKAAAEIHNDFEHGFIRAETIAYDDFIKYNGEAGAKENGKLRLEGKEYIVNDGDVMHFRFNV